MSVEQIKKRLFRGYMRPEYFYFPVKEKKATLILTIKQLLKSNYDVELKEFTSTSQTSWCKWQLINSNGEIVATSSSTSYSFTVFLDKYRVVIIESNIYNPFKEFQKEYELDLTDAQGSYTFELIGTPSIFAYRYRTKEVDNVYDYDRMTGYAGEHITINNASSKSILIIADLYLDDVLICSAPMIGGISLGSSTPANMYYIENPIHFDYSVQTNSLSTSLRYILDTNANECFGYDIFYRDGNQNLIIDVTKENYHSKISELKENPNITITSSQPWFRYHVQRRSLSDDRVLYDDYSVYNYTYGARELTYNKFIVEYYLTLYQTDCMDVYYDPNTYNVLSTLNEEVRVFNLSKAVVGYGIRQFFFRSVVNKKYDDTDEVIADLINYMGYDVLGITRFKIDDIYIHDVVDNIMRNKSYLNAVTPMTGSSTNINMRQTGVLNNKTNPITTQARIFLENGDVEDILFGGFKWCSSDNN